MASPAAAAGVGDGEAVTGDMVSAGFAELERQQQLLATCTRLYQQLQDHFGSLERGLAARSDALRARRRAFDARTHRALDALHQREASIDGSVARALDHVDSLSAAAAAAAAGGGSKGDAASDAEAAGLAESLRALCARMDSAAFLGFVVARRKEADALRAEMPPALKLCVDPAKFVMDAVADVFPVDRREAKSPADLAWACVLILEAAVPALADPDPKISAAGRWCRGPRGSARGGWPGSGRRPRSGRAGWKRPSRPTRTPSCSTWPHIIEELIAKRQQLDAVNFAYEAGLQEKFPPVPLLKSYLEDSKKTSSTNSDDSSTRAANQGNVNKKEQSALRAVIKCVEDRKLEAEFPLEDLRKQLEELEKAKTEKKKAASSPSSGGSSGPASKRIRASNGGPSPMPPAKAGPDPTRHFSVFTSRIEQRKISRLMRDAWKSFHIKVGVEKLSEQSRRCLVQCCNAITEKPPRIVLKVVEIQNVPAFLLLPLHPERPSSKPAMLQQLYQ
ncbi:hypothetical protein PR202_ga28226 [Eleusine coracana subsp. coracana]|uniref:FRIGIDA-like protein n=1 Tax=Eleusine coracana subsp. coracana TaxID=191504 RepID=A0AAV5DI13_ELECO|nr:hypothetical protein PR202_ga28226 [Eleusine coracana subsp. coracana]